MHRFTGVVVREKAEVSEWRPCFVRYPTDVMSTIGKAPDVEGIDSGEADDQFHIIDNTR
jgi:hypothetical protein